MKISPRLRPLLGFPTRRLMGTVTHVATSQRVLALTFDDGPTPGVTDRALDLLARHQAKATFFMMGTSAKAHPDLVKRVALEGHAVCNHGWNHPSFRRITGKERRDQVRACAQALSPYEIRYFRPPYGHQDFASRLDLLRLGYRVVAWDIHVGDWWQTDPHNLHRMHRELVRPGCIIVLHDGLYVESDPDKTFPMEAQPNPDREPMLAALEMLLEEFSSSYRFLTVPDLLACGRPGLRNWFV